MSSASVGRTWIFAATLALVLCALPAWGQVIVDTSVSSTTTSFSITTAQANELIMIAGDGWNNPAPTAPTFTVDGNPATFIAYAENDAGNTGGAAAYFYVAPTAGVHNIVETSTGSYAAFALNNFAVALQNACVAGMTSATNATTVFTNTISLSVAATGGSFLFITPNFNSAVTTPGVINWTGSPSAPTNVITGHVDGGLDSGIAAVNPAVTATYNVTATDPQGGGSGVAIVAVDIQPEAPAAVGNLALNTPTLNSMNVTWSEPGECGAGLPAGSFGDLRYSTSPIVTQANYNAATVVAGVPAPTGTPGTPTSMTVSGLAPDTLYYFAIEYVDNAGRRGALSNVPSLETLENLPPTQVTDLRIISQVGSLVTVQWTAQGENLNRGADSSCDFRMRVGQGCVSLTAADFAAVPPPGVTVIPGPPVPAAPGTVQTFTFNVGGSYTQFAVAMVNYDNDGGADNNRGPVCNQPVCGTTGAPTWQAAPVGSDVGGGISNTTPNSVDPVLAINPATNLPGVAWTAPNTTVGGSPNPAIYFRELVGGVWTEFAGSGSTGGVSNNANVNQFPSLAYEASGTPVIAWEAQGAGTNTVIFVRAFTGGAWSELSGSGSGNGIGGGAGTAVEPSIAVNPVTGQPGVAWSQFFSGVFRTYFREYNGTTTWVEFAGSGSNQGVSSDSGNAVDTSLTYDPTGHPVIAWADTTSGQYEIYVRTFNGTSWVDYAGSGSGNGISTTSATAINRRPSVQTDAAGHPYVVWSENPGNGNIQIFGRTFNGASWVDFGPGSSTVGIDGTPNSSVRPHLSKSPTTDRTFFLVWQDFSDPDGMPEIYGKWYSDGLWKVIGNASASNGGISNSGVPAAHPSGGVAGGATPSLYVAWQGGTGSNGQVYVKTLSLVGVTDGPKEVVLAGGQGSGGQYQVFSNGAVSPPYAPLSLRTLPWAMYDSANGTLHPACGDVEGAGSDDVVLGLGTYTQAGGWAAVMRDNSGVFGLLAWIHFPWVAYDAANGATYPAVGNFDGSGVASVALGQGSFPGGGGGWLALFGNNNNGFAFQRWIQGGFATYNASNGEVHPAAGDVDGDGTDELVLGFGHGGAGAVQVLGDKLHNFALQGSLVYANSGYNGLNGTTWPTVANATWKTGPEIIVGAGKGGNGVACIYGGSSTSFARIGSLVVPWSAYDTSVGEVRPAAGTTDASGYPSVVAGLGSFSPGGWVYVFASVATSSPTGTWIRFVPGSASYDQTNGETFPAVGQLR